jgi:ribosome-associated protein
MDLSDRAAQFRVIDRHPRPGERGCAGESLLTATLRRARLDAAICGHPEESNQLNRVVAPRALKGRAGAPEPSPALPGSVQDLTGLILARLEDDKAQDVVQIDLRDKSSVADAMIVASGRSHRHVGAIADHVLRALKEHGHGRARVEGLPHCDWVLIDAGDVIVHLFRPEVRDFYNLEKIWSSEPPRARSAKVETGFAIRTRSSF